MKYVIHLGLLACCLSLLSTSCRIEADPISYGQDQCNFCKMNIVDKAHSAQYVSDKGKQFKYDAIECLIREQLRNDIQNIAINLVANYGNPGEMIDAESAFYIISPEIKSPMGANLSAVADESTAKEILKEHSGAMFTWETIKNEIEGKK